MTTIIDIVSWESCRTCELNFTGRQQVTIEQVQFSKINLVLETAIKLEDAVRGAVLNHKCREVKP